jgi:hypothetical protein
VQGLGFDNIASNNLLYIGTNLCNSDAKGVNGNTLTCDTSTPLPGTSLSSLPITIIVTGKKPYTCTSSSCVFSYTSSQTPILKSVYPRAGTAFNMIKFFGTHKIIDLGGEDGSGRSMGDVRGLYFGGSYCSRFDILELEISPSTDQFISCTVSPVQEGGYYNVTEWVVPGIATNVARMNYGSILNQINYQFMVIPNISSVSSHNGGSQGLTITIFGTGFSRNSTSINVTAANTSCKVVSST